MKQRQDLKQHHQSLIDIRNAVDAIAHAPGCPADVAERLRKVDGLIAGAASAINSALRLTLPDETEAV